MTLGKKLSSYRTINGLTQGQLGEKLNVSAQAVSKWENDLASPDIATLKRLAELYKVTLDELVDLNSGFGAPVQEEPELKEESPKAEEVKLIGFCKKCGITVNEENLGETEPVILCKKCKEQNRREAELRAEAAKRQKEAEERKRAADFKAKQDTIRKTRNKSFIVAGLVTLVLVILSIIYSIKNGEYIILSTTFFSAYVVFSFIALLFYDGAVPDLLCFMSSATIKFPGLIFTFDLDGFIWLIMMKLLFAAIGFVFGVLTSIFGIILGLIISPFVFPFKLISIQRAIRTGNDSIIN